MMHRQQRDHGKAPESGSVIWPRQGWRCFARAKPALFSSPHAQPPARQHVPCISRLPAAQTNDRTCGDRGSNGIVTSAGERAFSSEYIRNTCSSQTQIMTFRRRWHQQDLVCGYTHVLVAVLWHLRGITMHHSRKFPFLLQTVIHTFSQTARQNPRPRRQQHLNDSYFIQLLINSIFMSYGLPRSALPGSAPRCPSDAAIPHGAFSGPACSAMRLRDARQPRRFPNGFCRPRPLAMRTADIILLGPWSNFGAPAPRNPPSGS